jgi:hypothetical protein
VTAPVLPSARRHADARFAWNDDTPTERARTKNAARGVARILESALHPAPPTPLNPKTVGPYRAFDGARFPLERLKTIKRALGGTINDVVLTLVTGHCSTSEGVLDLARCLCPEPEACAA